MKALKVNPAASLTWGKSKSSSPWHHLTLSPGRSRAAKTQAVTTKAVLPPQLRAWLVAQSDIVSELLTPVEKRSLERGRVLVAVAGGPWVLAGMRLAWHCRD